MTTPDGRTTTTRTRLVDAAIDEFLRVGPGATSWGDVCAAAGTTKGVVHHHFPGGKEELIVAAVERNAAQVDRLLARAQQGVDAGEAIVQFFDLYADVLDADPDRGCPIAASVVDASATSEAVRRATVEAFTGWIDALATSIDDRDVAATVVATMEGSILLARSARDPDLMRRTGRVLAAMLRACAT